MTERVVRALVVIVRRKEVEKMKGGKGLFYSIYY